MFPGRGLVLLDSPNLVLEFPAVYSDPLTYSDFHGAIHIGWDSELVSLTSVPYKTNGIVAAKPTHRLIKYNQGKTNK